MRLIQKSAVFLGITGVLLALALATVMPAFIR